MFFSNAATYAMRAVLYLAINSSEDNKIGIREIAEKLDVPYHFLGKIMQQLSRKDIISSIKGPNGGFYLTPQQLEEAMIGVVENYEERDKFFRCGLGLRDCSETNPCPIHNDYKLFRNELYHKLSKQSIREWAEQVVAGNVVIRL